MHLWPSMKLRDSFKNAYLEKLEWNLLQMKIDKKTQAQTPTSSDHQKKLLHDNDSNNQEEESQTENSKDCGFLVFCKGILFIFSCCYCCFCCGACVAGEEN